MVEKMICRIVFGIFVTNFVAFIANAQVNTPPDTSFTYYSAFANVKKVNPKAAIPVLHLGDSVTAVRNITYCTVNQRQLKLDVFAPKYNKARKLPAVLIIFGGGWRSGNRSMHVQMAQAIAARGYITVTVDYRLSTEALYPAAVNDLKTAIKWLRQNAETYGVDRDKVAVWGFSAGGQLAALLGTTGGSALYKGGGFYNNQPDNLQAVVDVDGTLAFIHPESGEGDDSKKTSSATYWFGSGKTVRPELWQEASPLNHVDKNTPPILFLNSALDRMHAGRNDVVKKLDSLHIYTEVHTFAGSPHSFNMFEPWFTPTLNYTVAFLNKILKNNKN